MSDAPAATAERVEKGPQRQAVEQAARSEASAKEMTSQERADATAWFLEGSPEQHARVHFQLNVSEDSRKPRWINWTVQALERDRVAEIRTQAAKEHEGDDAKAGMIANLRIATEGTIEPNLKAPEILGSYADPADVLRARFGYKPGLIDHIAVKTLRATGFDDEDVREIDAVKI
jgi:hypothetical protein